MECGQSHDIDKNAGHNELRDATVKERHYSQPASTLWLAEIYGEQSLLIIAVLWNGFFFLSESFAKQRMKFF